MLKTAVMLKASLQSFYKIIQSLSCAAAMPTLPPGTHAFTSKMETTKGETSCVYSKKKKHNYT